VTVLFSAMGPAWVAWVWASLSALGLMGSLAVFIAATWPAE
jgi:hypothetical protein